MKSGIYRITCLMNGKFYIGSAVNIKKRWINHTFLLNNNIHLNKILQNSWNKYGENYFDWDVIEYCEKKILIEREQYYLDYMKPQFNISKTAGSNLGLKSSEETKRKVGIATKGRIVSKETCQKISESKIGKKFSKEHCKNISIARKQIKPSLLRRRRFSNDDIINIRTNKLTVSQNAREYGCSSDMIRRIKDYRSYKDVR